MAAKFLASHGLDLDAVMSNIQLSSASQKDTKAQKSQLISKIIGARLPQRPPTTLWDVSISDGLISSIDSHHKPPFDVSTLVGILDAKGRLLIPSLCHAHIHLDKCFLLQDAKYGDLKIIRGDFAEAMSLTGQAKQRFEEDDLLRRGRRLIEESIEAGVTAMRAFVEVDEVVDLKCLDAGLKLKYEFRDICEVQICAFAQLALFTGEDGGARRRELMEEALTRADVDVVGSTPYVEGDEGKMLRNVEWTIRKALKTGKHMDLHLDYNLAAGSPLIWRVLEELGEQGWTRNARPLQKICLGHCTRLTMFTKNEWQRLKHDIGDLPISFIGLPTSDLFMMGRPEDDSNGGGQRMRGTLQIPQMVRQYGLNGAIAINNVGNAFTPQGNCDPLSVASLGVAVYQAGTKSDTDILFVSIKNTGILCARLMLIGLCFGECQNCDRL